MEDFLLVLAVPFAVAIWLFIAMRWRRALVAFLCYMPVTGVAILLSHHNPVAVMTKEALLVLPLYFTLFVLDAASLRSVRISPAILVMLGLLVFVVLIQCANPHLPNLLVGVIGAAVWLYYLPFIFVGAAYVAGPDDLVRLNRIMLVAALVPTTVGLIQWGLAQAIGYQNAISMFYGYDGAMAATGNFSRFDLSTGGTVFRIPATFSFVTQYFGFLFAMLVPSYIAMHTDPSPKWRRFGLFMLLFVSVSAILSGSRQAYVFVPLLILLMNVLDGRLSGILSGIFLVPVVLITVLMVAGLDPLSIFHWTEQLAGTYSDNYFLRDPIMALDEFPLGAGTGMDTGQAARYAFQTAHFFINSLDFNAESHYLKAIVELGAPGFLIVLGLFGVVIAELLRIRRDLKQPALRSIASAFAAFAIAVAINSAKGWQIDQDPINAYFWLFLGMASRLPSLAPAVARRVREVARPQAGWRPVGVRQRLAWRVPSRTR